MRRPLVSIIINNYNYGRFLEDAIKSALSQTYPDKEVIVVDDGSIDNSRDIIEQYALQGAIPVFKENGGQASAFNAGFAASRGELILFLDADDVLLPTCVEECVAAWKQGVTKVQVRMQVVDESLRPMGRTFPLKYVRMPSGDFESVILKWRVYPSPPTSGNLFSRDFLVKILPMPEDWRISADFYLLTLAGLSGRVVSVDKLLVMYRVHGANYWAASDLSLEWLRREVLLDKKQEELILDWCEKNGKRPFYPFIDGRFAKSRLALSALDQSCSLKRGTFRELALRGWIASFTWPFVPFTIRLKQSLFFLGLMVCPGPLVRRLLQWGINPSTRPRWVIAVSNLLEKLR